MAPIPPVQDTLILRNVVLGPYCPKKVTIDNKVSSPKHALQRHGSLLVWLSVTEAKWLPLCNKTQFSGRLLLSMNSLDFLGWYFVTPSFCRSCVMSFSSEKKGRYFRCLLW